MRKITLKEAVKFHGHLGPYLVLGLLAGELALKKLKSKKYFGLHVAVRGADKKPKSCLIDGLQLSTGATYGKGNIRKTGARGIKIIVTNKSSGRKTALSIKTTILHEIEAAEGHAAAEKLAKKLFKQKSLFNLAPITKT